ncbi:hypothetical protein CW731_15310 [Polaribacter sp. ALD11]|nr:hypothetical protein CW731_15310 [Polaribacter sp. ALD11]
MDLDFSRFIWHLVDENEWISMMTSYIKVASSEKDNAIIRNTLIEGKVVNKGVKVRGKLVLPFYKLKGDIMS